MKENKEGGHEFEGISFTRLFGTWLQAEKSSLVLAANLPAGACMVGRRKDGKVMFQSAGQAEFRALAIGSSGTIWAAEKNYLWKWENISETGGYMADGGRLYVARQRIFTSDLGTRDMAVDGNDSLLMASGAYSVVGRAAADASFELVWKPPFVTKIAREDRCGLSGLALYDKSRHCVSMWGRTDEPLGWREGFEDGGCVMLIDDSSVFCRGLCLPRAPRWRGEELYLLNAGTAEFGKVDAETKCFVPVCQCPGYPTGLAFLRQWAVISVSSRPPEGTEDLSLPAAASFAAGKITPFSGLLLVDLASGDIAHHAYAESGDFTANAVAVLAGCPQAVFMSTDDSKLDSLVTAPRPKKAAKG